jgi:hypothetical protein
MSAANPPASSAGILPSQRYACISEIASRASYVGTEIELTVILLQRSGRLDPATYYYLMRTYAECIMAAHRQIYAILWQ